MENSGNDFIPYRNEGKLYAVIKSPGKFFSKKREYRVEAWGQLCDGKDHKQLVNLMMYNRFPNHGKGYVYLSWRAVPDYPEINNFPRQGEIISPIPYSGIAYE